MHNLKRESEIISLIKASGDYATVEYLANTLSLSQSTVRRNLQELELKGIVKRSYGGVTYAEVENGLAPFNLRTRSNALNKIIVCRLACSLIKDGDVIFTDCSSTAYCLTNFLKEFKNITVISNGIETVNSLRASTLTVYSTGGKVSPTNKVALIGQQALDFIDGIHADLTLLSAFGVDNGGNIYDVYDDEIAVRKKMMKNSNANYLLLDGSKFGKTAPFKLANVNDFDGVITDKYSDGFLKGQIKTKIITQ